MVRKIPITSLEPLHYDDEESGVRYSVRPRTGRNALKFTAICSAMGGADNIDKIDGICDIVDLFLCDVQPIGKGEKFPKKPDNMKYSEVLDEDAILFVYFAILKESGLLVEEKKSSSQPQSQNSEESTTQNTIVDSVGVPEESSAV